MERVLADGPTFRKPPVVEVALSVQHEPLAGLTTPMVARYWERVRGQFPKWTEHPPIAPAFESFGPPVAQRARFAFQFANTPTPTRAMLEDEAGDQLLQLQPDRFVRNWRRYKNEGAPYPRYQTTHRPEFRTALEDYAAFISEMELGDLVPNQVEVTYVNHVAPEGAWERHGQLAAVMSVLSPSAADSALGEPEEIDVNLRYRILGIDGEPVGRLHVTGRPIYQPSDLTPLFAINLTARIGMSGGGIDDILQALDRGHDFLVNAFRALTTDEMHELWGLQR